MAAILCDSLVKNFGDPPTEVLKTLSFTVEEGEFVAVTGRSGSGKSTLLYVTSGLDDPTSGSVRLFDHDIHHLPPGELHRFRNERMGFVFQFHYLIPELNSIENILMPARRTRSEREKKTRAMELVDRFDLGHCVKKYPAQMSGGEQQRVAVARALIMEPDIIFADEPTGNLDSQNGEKVLDIFESINRDHGTTVILVTHEMDFAARAGRRIRLMDGQIVYDRKNRRRKG